MAFAYSCTQLIIKVLVCCLKPWLICVSAAYALIGFVVAASDDGLAKCRTIHRRYLHRNTFTYHDKLFGFFRSLKYCMSHDYQQVVRVQVARVKVVWVQAVRAHLTA